MKTYYSHGKLLLSGEYLVLDGASALALPTRPGQWLRVTESQTDGLQWTSRNPDGSSWFETHFAPSELRGLVGKQPLPSDVRGRLGHILGAILSLQPDFLTELEGSVVETRLEFPRQWGLGSSSTLISNLASWSGTDPFALLSLTLGGSGYDIAAARQQQPFVYHLEAGGSPVIEALDFNPPFAESLFFVYLNQKQDSREGIRRYRNRSFDREGAVRAVSELTRKLAGATSLEGFCEALDTHESLLSEILGMPPVKKRLFPDYPGSIKSLGAWGGDFILATGTESEREYFKEKGYSTLRSYRELIL